VWRAEGTDAQCIVTTLSRHSPVTEGSCPDRSHRSETRRHTHLSYAGGIPVARIIGARNTDFAFHAGAPTEADCADYLHRRPPGFWLKLLDCRTDLTRVVRLPPPGRGATMLRRQPIPSTAQSSRRSSLDRTMTFTWQLNASHIPVIPTMPSDANGAGDVSVTPCSMSA
jgi:hypothetical protein